MSDCPNKPTFLPEAVWKALMNLPALRYMKAPVNTEAELYEKYPIGNEKGTFAFVHNDNTFYTYHPRGWNRGEWKPISADSISSFFEIDKEFLREGDILVYDNSKSKFVINSGNVWNKLLGEIKDKFSQVAKFLNQVDEVPANESDPGVYFIHKDKDEGGVNIEFRALYIVLGKKSIKIWNSSDYKTKIEVDAELAKKANQTQVNDIAASIDVLAVTKAEKSVVDALANGIIRQSTVDTYNTGTNSLAAVYGLTTGNNGSNGKVKLNGWDVLIRKDETKSGKPNRYNWNGSIWVDMETGIYDESVALSGGSSKTLQEIDEEKANALELLSCIGRNILFPNTGNIKNGVIDNLGTRKYSNHIEITDITSIYLEYGAGSNYSPVNYFDENKSFISAINDVGGQIKTTVINSHPSNAKSVIISGITACIGYESRNNIINNFNSRNLVDDSDFAFIGTNVDRFIYTNNVTAKSIVKPNTWTKNKIEITATTRYQLSQDDIPFEIGKSYSFGVFVRPILGSYNGKMIFYANGGAINIPLAIKRISLGDGWEFCYYENYIPTVDRGLVFFIDATPTEPTIIEAVHPMVIVGDKIAPVLYNNLNYFYTQTIRSLKTNDNRNIFKDSALLTVDSPNSPIKISKQAGSPTTYIEENLWSGNQIRIYAKKGDRVQVVQDIKSEIGKPISIGFFYKRISGTKSINFIFYNGTSFIYPIGTSSEVWDGWIFQKYEGYINDLSETTRTYIELDNRTGVDENEVIMAFPMATPTASITPELRDGLTYAVRNIESSIGGKWEDYELVSYGDSITSIGNGTQLAPFVITDESSWQIMVSSILRFSKHYGRGVGGQTFSWNENTWYANDKGEYVGRPGQTEQPSGSTIHKGAFCSWDRITTMIPQNFKGVLFIMGGTNDFGVTFNIGDNPTFNSTNTLDSDWFASDLYIGGDYDITTFKGSIASTVMKMEIWCPDAIIVLGTPLSGMRNALSEYNHAENSSSLILLDYANALIETAQFMSVPYIDIFSTTGINQINRAKYITDSVHPYNRNGKEALARAVIAGIEDVQPKIFE